jgi:hypothetical protein
MSSRRTNEKQRQDQGRTKVATGVFACGKENMSAEKVILLPIKMTLLPNKMTLLPNKMTLLPNKMTLLPNKTTLSPIKMTFLPNKISFLGGKMSCRAMRFFENQFGGCLNKACSFAVSSS